jgi:hypothetical protein
VTDAKHKAMNARRHAETYLAKEMSRIRRIYHSKPFGYFDKANRWYPSIAEKCECCSDVKKPTGRNTRSLYNHCCTKYHIRRLIKKKGMVDRLLREVKNFSVETARQIQIEFKRAETLEKQYRDEQRAEKVTSHARKLEL